MADASESVKKSVASTKRLADALDITQKKAKEVLKALEQTGTLGSKSTEKIVKSLKDASTPIKDIKHGLRDMSGRLSKLHFEKALDPKKAIALHKKMGDIRDVLKDIEKGKTFEEKQAVIESLKKEMAGLETDLKGTEEAANFKMKFADPKTWQTLFSDIAKAPDLISGLGTAAKGVGGMFGKVTKIMSSWPVAALTAFAEMTLEADQFIKDQNKIFLRFRGPDIMTPDVAKQFKEFNAQIFNLSDNLRTGLNAKDIQAFMESVTQAGANITTLNKGLTTYRDAVYIAAKASKTLGMDLSWVGTHMSEMMTDFRMDLDDVDKAFIQVAFDAKKSGLSTDRFWNTIQNATASLAFYGVGLKSASKTLTAFTNNAVGGSKDAQDAVENMYDAFKGLDIASQGAMLQFAGKETADKMFQSVVDTLNKKKTTIQSKIEVLQGKEQTQDVVDAIDKLNKDLDANEAKIAEYSGVIGKSSVAQVAQLGALAQDVEGQNAVPILLEGALRKIAEVGKEGSLANINGEKLLTLMKGAEGSIKLNAQTTKMLVRFADITNAKLTRLSKMTAKDWNKFFSKGGPDVEALKEIWASNEATNGLLDKANSGDEDAIDKLQETLKSNKVVAGMMDKQFTRQDKSDDEMADKADDTFQKIVKQTLSMKEMAGMAGDQAHYWTASLGLFTGIAGGVTSIVGILNSKFPAYQRSSQKAAQKQFIKQAEQNKDLKKLLDANTEGVISTDSQAKMTVYLTEKISSMSDAVESMSTEGRTLSAAQTATDPVAVLQSGIDKLEKQATSANKKGNKDLANRISGKISQLKSFQLMAKNDPKKLQKAMSEEIDVNEKELDSNNEILSNDQASLENLKKIGSANADIEEMTKLMMEADPKSMKLLADKLEDQGDNLKNVASNIDTGILKQAAAVGGHPNLEEYVANQVASTGMTMGIGGSFSVPTAPKVGTTTPKADGGIFTAPTRALIAERGPEAVVPLGKGGGGAGRNVSITVNAMEKDLAQKIANEVRAVLYKERIG
jgi:TP901 family phage tail tape measure protein